jgi:hypothetical protein
MGKRGTRLPGFCLNRIRPHARVRSPTIQAKNDKSDDTKIDDKIENSSCSVCEEKLDGGLKQGSVISRKIMIVIDSSFEAKSALQWALTHTVQNHDTIVLLHVIKSSKQGVCETNDIIVCLISSTMNLSSRVVLMWQLLMMKLLPRRQIQGLMNLLLLSRIFAI